MFFKNKEESFFTYKEDINKSLGRELVARVRSIITIFLRARSSLSKVFDLTFVFNLSSKSKVLGLLNLSIKLKISFKVS